jgi:DNA processing protein
MSVEHLDPDDLAWVALHRSGKLDIGAASAFCTRFGHLSALWTTSNSRLEELGSAGTMLEQARDSTKADNAIQTLTEMKRLGIDLLRCSDREYPETLKSLRGHQGPPIMLFHKGRLRSFEKCVAIVGTRECTHRGFEAAREIAEELARRKYTVVSGLARGIDASAHHGALAAGGKTVAVLAWLQKPYPYEHWRLLDDIITDGAALSENLETPSEVDKSRFVLRNRIISGISDYLIAVESGATGGTIRQVDFAVSQGKRVLAYKPREGDVVAQRGYSTFIDRGALSVGSIEEIVMELEKSPPRAQEKIDRWATRLT